MRKEEEGEKEEEGRRRREEGGEKEEERRRGREGGGEKEGEKRRNKRSGTYTITNYCVQICWLFIQINAMTTQQQAGMFGKGP